MVEKDLDKKILLQLMKNSRLGLSEIAAKVGTTRQTVAKKIKQLEKANVITSFTLRLNTEKLGLNTKAYIFLREDPAAEFRKKNEEVIERFPQISEFHRLFGRYSAILEVFVKNSNELKKLVKRIHKLKGVRETETFIVHSTVKDRPEEPFVRVLKFKS